MARIYLTPQQEQHPLFMIKLPIYSDTGWELLDGATLRGRVKNGIAIIVFEGYTFNGVLESDTLVTTLPERYRPSALVYFSFASNSKTPVPYSCRIQTGGAIRTYARYDTDNVIGCVTYPVK